MIDIIVKEDPKDLDYKFPIIVEGVHNFVLVTGLDDCGYFIGTCIAGNSPALIGHHGKWDRSYYRYFSGQVTLSNQ